jgi:TnpA family transposase
MDIDTTYIDNNTTNINISMQNINDAIKLNYDNMNAIMYNIQNGETPKESIAILLCKFDQYNSTYKSLINTLNSLRTM